MSFVTTETDTLGDILEEASDLLRTMDDYPQLRYGDAYVDHRDRILRNLIAANRALQSHFEVTA